VFRPIDRTETSDLSAPPIVVLFAFVQRAARDADMVSTLSAAQSLRASLATTAAIGGAPEWVTLNPRTPPDGSASDPPYPG
jgi:hypothetical protein